MEISAVEEQIICPCYKERQQFQKLVELKDFGLEVYCHRICTDKVSPGEAVDAINTSRDVFILHNKKDVKITTSQLTPELEKKNISCPRCRKRFVHAQKLIKEVKSIDKKIVMGICDHCRKRTVVSTKPFCVCQKIVKLFKTGKDEQMEDTKKTMPSKKGHLLKEKRKEIHSYSNFQIYQDTYSPAIRHEPEVQQLFYSDTRSQSDVTEISETDLIDVCIKQAVTFTEPVPPTKTSLVHTTQEINDNQVPVTSLVDSDTTFMETFLGVKELPRPSIKNRKQDNIFEDTPSIDAKQELKRRHDISLRQIVKLEKDSGVRKITGVYETPKIAQNVKNFSTDLKLGHSNDKVAKSEQYVAKSKSLPYASMENVLKPHFSFIFPKEKKKEKQINVDVSSSQLIKAIQEKFRLESERLNKRKEEERQRKQEEKKRAQEEKKRQAEERKRLADEEKRLADEEKRQAEDEKKLADEEKRLADEEKKRIEHEKKNISEEQKSLTKRDKSRDIILGKDDSKKDTKLKSVQRSKDSIKGKAVLKMGDQSKPSGKDMDVEKDTKLKPEKEIFETEQEEELHTGNLETLKSIEKETSEKLPSDKKGKILRDKNQQKDIKNKFKLEESLRKEKVASSKEEKSIKKRRDIFNELESPTSNVDESINKENNEMSVKKRRSKLLTKDDLSKSRKEKEDFIKLRAAYLTEKALKNNQKLELEALKAKQDAEQLKMSKKLNNKSGSKKSSKLVNIKKVSKAKKPFDIDPELLKSHNEYHTKSGQNTSACPICLDSELELEVLSLDYIRNVKKDNINDIIIGERIYKNRPRLEKIKKTEGFSSFFHKNVHIESDHQLQQPTSAQAQGTEPVQKKILRRISKNAAELLETEPKGVVRYALSDRTFIDKGWTLLPTEKVVRKMNVYRMHPAHPEFDWFKHNKNKGLMTYDTGERLAEFDDNGRGRWYYRNGRLALDYYEAEETNAQQRFVIYSSGEPDERGRTHPITILATFDYLGNGIVLDHAGKTRLKYNQTEGVVLDRTIGPVSHWKWHTLNDPPVLQQVMIDTQLPHKDPDILKLGSPPDNTTPRDNEEMLAIEFENFIKEKRKKLSQRFKPFQIKMKALKINQHFSLKILDQATVYLIFRDGLTNLRVNMGMILDDKEIVDTDTSEVGEVSNSLLRYPARTDSLAGLQRSVVHAQRYERQHAERERRLLRPAACDSADLITAATSPPMRPPLRTLPNGSSNTTEYASNKSSNILYCDNRRPY